MELVYVTKENKRLRQDMQIGNDELSAFSAEASYISQHKAPCKQSHNHATSS